MKKFYLYIAISFGVACISLVGFLGAYYFSNRYIDDTEVELVEYSADSIKDINESKKENEVKENAKIVQNIYSDESIEDINQRKEKTLSEYKSINFSHLYNDEVVMESEIMVPSFMQEVTVDEMDKYFPNFQVVTINDDVVEVVSEVEQQTYYVIKENEGFVEVFYYGEEGLLESYERTNVLYNSLSNYEKHLIKSGIICYDLAELYDILQNYES